MLIGLIIAPYVLLALAARFGRLPTVTIGSFVFLILSGTDASLSYVDVAFHLWSEPDAEAALAFISIPTVQIFFSLIGIGLLVGIGEWLARRREKGADESAPSSDRWRFRLQEERLDVAIEEVAGPKTPKPLRHTL